MEATRIEILKDGEWLPLRLNTNQKVKYNKVINKIGNVADRSISHTNTFDIPNIYQNIERLGLNKFNAYTIANNLNKKYEARYFVEGTLLQSGFVVINNTNENSIKINFIDSALGIIDNWGSTTYEELLKSTDLNIPSDYQTAINEMKGYSMPTDSVLQKLNLVGSRGHKLALFPNNLNAIGDKFQKDEDGERVLDTFNPYQSRPVFNLKAFFDLITYSYNYTPIYDASIDWAKIQETFMVSNGLISGQREDGGITTDFYESVTIKTVYEDGGFGNYTLYGILGFNQDKGISPINLGVTLDAPQGDSFYNDKRIFFQPDLSGGNLGEMTFNVSSPIRTNTTLSVFSVYRRTDEPLRVIRNGIGSVSNSNTITVNKNVFNSSLPSSLYGEFLGVMVQYTFETNSSLAKIYDLVSNATEKYISDTVSYDENGQFIGTIINLTYAAPRVSIKKLLNGIMHKQGILLNINAKDKEATFFSYGAYQDKKESGIYYNWSNYFQKNESIEYSTNFGNNYGIVNRIGLASPYLGNTTDINIGNLESSKYKEFNEDYGSTFKDVENVLNILNTNTYYEFTNTGLGLIEQTSDVLGLTQTRADKTTQGAISSLETLSNVNYAALPEGVKQWYNIVKYAVKIKAKFIIPLKIFKNIDMSTPIFVEELGGYFIIEEISEYIDGQNFVNISLLKLIDNLKD